MRRNVAEGGYYMIVHLEGVFNGLWRDFSMFHSWKFQMRSRMVATLLPPNASTSYLARVYKKPLLGIAMGRYLMIYGQRNREIQVW